MDEKIVRVGLVGFGTVGSGVVKILQDNVQEIAERTGIRPQLVCVADKDTTTPRPVTLPEGVLTGDINRLLNDKSIEIAIELVGGTTFAKELVMKMLTSGKHVVTANKALLAEHGGELYQAAIKAKRCIAFEASCCGGIPIISALRTGLAANDITALYGICNGTCNYILTHMTRSGTSFDAMLKAAQQKGFAEADPTLDINGTDTAHKLAILAGLAFGCRIEMKDVYIEGIDGIDITDIRNAKEMGYILKLLAIGEKDAAGQISLRVHPSFISEDTPLADVDGPFNAVSVFGNAVGNVMFYGRGAGMMPTASAVVADIIDIALGTSERLIERMPMVTEKRRAANFRRIDEITSRFYLRITAKDQPGVFARFGQALSKHNISISGAMQREIAGPNGNVPVIITTHPAKQKHITAALNELQKLDVVCEKPVCIRIVEIPEDKE